MVSFVSNFGSDPKRNQHIWQRSPNNPIIPYGDDWCREFIAPSTVFVDGDHITLFAEGGADDREYIGRYTTTAQRAFSGGWIPDSGNPILGPSPDGFDRGSVFDPAALRFRGRTHLYYSATAGGAHAFAGLADAASDAKPADEVIGLALESDSGFSRQPTPVLVGRCPNVIAWEDTVILFHVDVVAGGYRIFAARSTDGIHFEAEGAKPVLDVGEAGEWDSFTVTHPKVFADDGAFVMLYAGDNTRIDDPTGVGIATSDDLIRWHKHPGNPIFTPGDDDAFDSLSVGSAVPFRVEGKWHIAYAGGSRPVAEGLQSQIGIARLDETRAEG